MTSGIDLGMAASGRAKLKAFGDFNCPDKIDGLRLPQDMAETQRNALADVPDTHRRSGYARISTYGQTLNDQTGRLHAEQCAEI